MPKLNIGPLHIGAIGLLAVGAAGVYFFHKRKSTDMHNIAVFKPNTAPANSGYDDIHGFDIRDYPEESPVYRMRTKQPNGIINTTTWWQNSNTAMSIDLPDRENQVALSGYIQTAPMP